MYPVKGNLKSRLAPKAPNNQQIPSNHPHSNVKIVFCMESNPKSAVKFLLIIFSSSTPTVFIVLVDASLVHNSIYDRKANKQAWQEQLCQAAAQHCVHA